MLRLNGSRQVRSFLPAGLLLLAVLVFAPPGLAQPATDTLVWSPALDAVPGLRDTSELSYHGAAGSLLGTDPATASRLQAAGGTPVAVVPGEALYVFLVEDPARARFAEPARLLAYSGHEALVAIAADEPPELTAESREELHGLAQPVRIDGRPIAWPDVTAPVTDLPRTRDPIVQAIVAGVQQADLDEIWQTLDDFENRYISAEGNLQSTQWMLDTFHSYGLQAEFHYYMQSGQQRRNVVATLPGLVDPSKVVYICGHLDATSENTGLCAPGADDNGSGTAAVMEAAKILSQYLFEYTIKFACFNGEEQGLLGSAAYCDYIRSQGEDVVTAYNCDMIAYRGTDPAPPDLIIYTNSASQEFATTLSDAADQYIPGELDVIVHVESMSGSDHYSFWSEGYDAICSIEDEAWGDDFCPWYHTCNDRIERYPHDYILSCVKANVAALATTAVPMNPSGSFLAFGSLDLDDDAIGGSIGNGDGEANPGETLELLVTIRNLGQQPATQVHGSLASGSEEATVLQGNSNWPDIPAGGEAENTTAFRVQLAGSAVDGQILNFVLAMTDNTGNRDVPFTIEVAAPRLTYASHSFDDAAHGNANGVPDVGEVVVIPVTLSNGGSQAAEDVTAVLSTSSPHLVVIDENGAADLIPAGGAGALTPPFRVAVSPSAVAGEVLPLSLAIRAGFGYQTVSNFQIQVGSAVYDDVESESGWSLVAADDNATTGRWVRVDPNGTTYNGQPAQPEDDHTPAPGVYCFVTGQGSVGGAAGEQDLDGGKTTLTTPVYDLSHVVQPKVVYWRWYTNNLGNNPNEDTWLVQISSDGGNSWADLERTTQSANQWTRMEFVVADYVTPTAQVRVRFVASDSGSNSLLEAAVDDFQITGTPGVVEASEGALGPLVLRLDPPRPNPANAGSSVRFALPQAGEVSLQLFGIDGRLVRTLVDGPLAAGGHALAWDGRNDRGAAVAPGIYYVRLRAADGQERTQTLTILR
ncbi:MAG: M28 family peptidase [Candidatus Eisenbacteria bacterium]|nr:M28 family peptidase [Candidatus Eisenbacteria bacterium]